MPIPDDVVLERTLLRDDVFVRLRHAIVEGTFSPGEQLKDADLAAWLGVSRTPVREALLRLGECGLVEALPGRSTRVTPLDVRALREAREVVAAMHRLAVTEAVQHLSSTDINAMKEANRRFRVAVRDGDVEAAIVADDALHAIPVLASGNAAVRAVLDQFTPVLRRAERLRFAALSGRSSATRHAAFIRLCEAGDVEGAAANAFDTWHSLPAR